MSAQHKRGGPEAKQGRQKRAIARFDAKLATAPRDDSGVLKNIKLQVLETIRDRTQRNLEGNR